MDTIESDTTTHTIADIETAKHDAVILDVTLLVSHPTLYRLAHPYACGVCEVDCGNEEKLQEHRSKVGCGYGY